MSNCRIFCMLAIVVAVLSVSTVYGGPARSLASVVAARAKIPRAIRAPFRNNEMMTARGFGKRSQQFIKIKDDNFLKSDYEIPWSTDKFDAQDVFSSADNNESKPMNTQLDESYPVEWIVREMVGNAAFLRAILERCVDTNPRDGQVSLRELFNGAAVNNNLI